MIETADHGQRAQTQSCAAHKRKSKRKQTLVSADLNVRLAFWPREVAKLLGRSQTFVYRAIYRGWLRPISDGVRMMIPRTEIDRFLARATEYNPTSKPEPETKSQKESPEEVRNEAH